ncbi:hypothetical protein [Rheinheimera sp. MMS21-TC3]|uniref:hypothetical protein n=1 Tax=Rheinheimera sp. MMS21-TC3 TaxID=3072790 RepID=UPI0028C4F93D|nr:hypothetical protein [Rheinheimera sp. MMS21-TC3]WNO60429.1 hypothetical protein RDV63_05545 [Rheinheimera sp. MMS21-TC3]
MISIERLYSRQVPKSLNAEPTPRGLVALTLEDILNIIGRVQSKHMIGSFILDARIALDKKAQNRVVLALQSQLQHGGMNEHLALGLATTSVAEVCDTNICPKCKGTTKAYSKRYDKLFECSRCNGVGRIILTHDQLYKAINRFMPADQKLTQVEFQRKHYDNYMDCVNELHIEAGNASKWAKELLRRIETNWSGVE